MEGYKVSVAVVTYNPDKEKLLATLRSILLQKNIRFQIVIADDGSAEPEFTAVEQLFAQYGFTDYVLLHNEKNRGTVYNILSATENSTGTYIKTISPGDMLSGEDILREWTDYLERCGAVYSFADVVCYKNEESGVQAVECPAHPQIVSCYLNGDAEEARCRNLIFNDLFLGAALLCRRDVQLQYISEIAGKVVFAEDNIYRLMAYDRIPVCYFPHNAVVYEVGSGISTSGSSVWEERLRKDWDACTQLLMQRCTGEDSFDRLLRCRGQGKLVAKFMKLWRIVCDAKTRKNFLESVRTTRMTDDQLPKAFLYKVMEVSQIGD